MLVFNPDKRVTVEEAVSHPYPRSIKEEGVIDPVFKGNLNFDFDYDPNITKDNLIALLVEELKTFETGLIE